ncbi:MAG TPA: hypothetical protein DGG95_08260 [Cytophagales bacterium]|jgi:hypothetical protein|nr:hypothetical protein [Cytophagales bacterium]
MAIDVYDMADKKFNERLFYIDYDVLSELEEIFQSLRKLTGLRIDTEGKTRFYNSQLVLLGNF